MPARKLILVFILLVGGGLFLIGASAGAQTVERHAAEEPRAPSVDWLLTGRVYAGSVGDESHPLAGVGVYLYGANNAYPDPGAFIMSTTTNLEGAYGLTAPEGYEFYHIREMDPAGFLSAGATSVDGEVREPNWIEYASGPQGLDGLVLTGNKFWDELPPLEWTKTINEIEWFPTISVTAETSDTIQVVDVVTTWPANELTLLEQWNPAELKLLDWQVSPAYVPVVSETGRLTIQLPEDSQEITVTKWFHVEPCTWETTVLSETVLSGQTPVEIRPIPIHKTPPLLWIDSQYRPAVRAGEVATFTLSYGNDGGYENSVVLRNEFPPEAPFIFADPTPDREAEDGSWVEWDLGDLSGGAEGLIDVLVEIDGSLSPGSPITISDGIFDHTGELADETLIEYLVAEPQPIEWLKLVNGIPWNPDLLVPVETDDVITVIDVLTSSETLALTLREQWEPEHLELLDATVEPEGTTLDPAAGSLTWLLPSEPAQPYTLTKLFHVEPCDWPLTILEELLFVGDDPDPVVRPVPIEKWLPELWIDSHSPEQIFAGEPASLTLEYGNTGGRELGAHLVGEFPSTAPLLSADPPPDSLSGDGLLAEWAFESLEAGQQGTIEVVLNVDAELPPSTTIPVSGWILDHRGVVIDETTTSMHIPEPPVTFPGGDWPWYAQGEISVDPEPPIAGQPTKLCAQVVNNDPSLPQEVTLEFSVANFGIGLPFQPVGATELLVPAGSTATGCVIWVPPTPQHWCVQARILGERYPYVISQRNLDVDEPLQPGLPSPLTFPVGNPFDHPVTVTLGLVPLQPDWGLELSQDVIPNLPPGGEQAVVLTVTPPEGVTLPPDGTPIVDVEAYVDGVLIGGFRKLYRPPVLLHHFPDPIYAEREISIQPYPPRAGEPTEICVELRNVSELPQTAQVQFSWANLGIGLPFTPINGPRPVNLPPMSVVKECIHWIPPVGGQLCVQATLEIEGHQSQRSRRNIDLDEPLTPGVPHERLFPVGNPFDHPVTVTLGLVPHLPDWGLELSQDVIPNLAPGATQAITLTVTPPADQPLPPDGAPIVDLEAYVDGDLIGGIRKIYRPPVPVHRPRDPVYAETEIGVDPYPVLPGQPVKLSVELHNPTSQDQVVTATFSIAPFGIGLPFSTNAISPNPVPIFVPANGAARGFTTWTPPDWSGKFCVQVLLEIADHEAIWSRRNIDVGEPLRPGEPHSLDFQVGGWPYQEPVTVTLGLVPHRPGWEVSLSQQTLVNVQPAEPVTVTLTVTPALDAELGSGEPIVDVEAYVDNTLLGGFRKLDIPPIPLHKPHEKSYAESEIAIDPYPPQVGQETSVSVELANTGDTPAEVEVAFGWARFGMGIPFTSTGMLPPTRTVMLAPQITTTVAVTWTPSAAGHQCVLVRLNDVDGDYQEQWSQRNVDVEERPPCDVTKTFTFTVYNDSPFTATVDVGMITFNVPADWQVSVSPSGSVEIGPYGEATITVTVTIPCGSGSRSAYGQREIDALQVEAGSVPTVDVEGYIDGELAGGIEIQFVPPEERYLYLPILLRGN